MKHLRKVALLLCALMLLTTLAVSYTHLKGATGAAFSSSKLVHYQQTELDIPIYYGTHEQCLDAAIAGYWLSLIHI